MKPTILSLFLILLFISGSCTPAGPVQTVVLSPTPVAENAQHTAASLTATPLPPTATLAPTATTTPKPAPTETLLPPSPTATDQIMAEFRFMGTVRQMPEAEAVVVASFSQGIRLRAINQDPSGQWIYVQVAPYTYGWVYQSDVTGSGLVDLAQATPDVTATPVAQASGGLKCFLTITYTETGKPRLFQIYIQGLTPINPYTFKLFNPKGGLMYAADFKPKSNGTIFREYSADKSALGTYSLDVIFAGEDVTSCSENLVQK